MVDPGVAPADADPFANITQDNAALPPQPEPIVDTIAEPVKVCV